MYLRGRVRKLKKQEQDRKRESTPKQRFIPQMPRTAGVGWAETRSRKQPTAPSWVAGSQLPEPHCCLSGAVVAGN